MNGACGNSASTGCKTNTRADAQAGLSYRHTVPGCQASSASREHSVPDGHLWIRGVYRDFCDLGSERVLSQQIALRELLALLLTNTTQPAAPLASRTNFATFSRYFLHHFLGKIPAFSMGCCENKEQLKALPPAAKTHLFSCFLN